jgi:hypothetical protein
MEKHRMWLTLSYSFGSKPPATVHAESGRNSVAAGKQSLVMMKVSEEMPIFFTSFVHMCNIRN